MKNRLKLQNIHEGVSGEIKGKLYPMQEPGTARGGRETKVQEEVKEGDGKIRTKG